MFTIMRRCVASNSQALRSKVKVTFRGQMSNYCSECCVWSITSSLIMGFQNKWAQMFTIMRRCAASISQALRSKVKVTLRGQRSNYCSEFCVWSITSSLNMGFQNNWAQMFTIMRRCVASYSKAPVSKVKVTFRGQRSNYCLKCCVQVTYHGISK